jgi:hypothetical protein
MTKDNTIQYLETHDEKDGMNVFKAGTRYDWYILKKTPNTGFKTTVIDEDGNMTEIDLSKWPWLPNKYFDQIYSLIGAGCPILFDRTKYGSDKKDRVSHLKTSEFKYPLIRSTPENGVRYMYSNRNDFGFFGVSKVIFGESGVKNAITDIKGKYGMTQGAMAIKVTDKQEANLVKKALESNQFQKLLQACMWGNFRIDWRLFTFFKKDWYKEILEEDS